MKSTTPSIYGRGLFIVLLSALALAVYVSTSATAVTSGTNATLSPTSLTFSSQGIGTTSAPKVVTLINTGMASLTITSMAITGINAVDFAQTHNCGTSMAVGASCTVSVKAMRPGAVPFSPPYPQTPIFLVGVAYGEGKSDTPPIPAIHIFGSLTQYQYAATR